MLDQKLLQRFISFRKELHQHPETGFEEFETRKRIRRILNELGVKDQQMTQLQPTALYVDLKGEAPPAGERRCIAFRADMDALHMEQANHHLQYRSQNPGKAHMCGHDGHMTCLISFVPLFLEKIKEIPSNKIIRLFFQPAQQGPHSGAKKMIKDGCLQGVDQVYGFHQWPTAPLGELWCKQGPVMSQITILEITIKGTGGHGSQPQKCKQSIRAGIKFYQKALDYLDNLKKLKEGKFVCTLPIFKAGERFNVISQKTFICGSIRSFQEGLSHTITDKLTEFLEEVKSEGFQYQFSINNNAPINSNTKQEAEHVLRVGKQLFGEDKVGPGNLPFRASQDYAFFTRERPGAFFFFSTAQGQDSPMIHSCNFDFNDKLIPIAAKFWYHLALDRLHIK